MSRKCSAEKKNRITTPKTRNKTSLQELQFVGVANIQRWKSLKEAFSCENNTVFLTKLLDIAGEYLKSTNTEDDDKNNIGKIEEGNGNNILENTNKNNNNSDNSDKINIVEPIKTETEKPIEEITIKIIPDNNIRLLTENTQIKVSIPKSQIKYDEKKLKKANNKSKPDIDIRKAPDFKQTQNNPPIKVETEDEQQQQQIAIKIKLCYNCNTRHLVDRCPLQSPLVVVKDSITLDDWREQYFKMYEKLEEDNSDSEEKLLNKFSFAYLSLPDNLTIRETICPHGNVYTELNLQCYTEFGPLLGRRVKEVDIAEDFNMRDLYQVTTGQSNNRTVGNIYVNTENLEESNWLRFVKPAESRESRNLSAISRDENLYFVSVREISAGEELLYWEDELNATNSGKKKIEKTACGGCNMTFSHPLYYRTHCSIFHDVRYSLTIRKYHCKVCGVAVLGKENIMKHAVELHNGQGAYQCQFCKKFFLRLNYLEMHRTYGCSSNPHRSRPLCDFCGRKFCQPQKLKVHIKRMHSDMADVLKEFQCKSCMKLLGSRAALQRHSKEVHQKQVEGACACSKCGKLFQNKSNLKIHMLTHSGIKPFKCQESTCGAAFTTKQCLQFHYKKVHSFPEEKMPKIERSVDYTFEAYSGADDIDGGTINYMDNIKDSDNDNEDDNFSDFDDTNSLDNDDDITSNNLHSPPPSNHVDEDLDQSADSKHVITPQTPPLLEEYVPSAPNMKILTKGSKKWIGDGGNSGPNGLTVPSIVDQHIHSLATGGKMTEMTAAVVISHVQNHFGGGGETTELLTHRGYGGTRHESTSASLLVEAALDSVCSEPVMDNLDVVSHGTGLEQQEQQNCCSDSIVNNLYALSHTGGEDTLEDVTTYAGGGGGNHSEMSETRDINLMSPSVNDHISVCDDLNDELRQNSQSIGLDYSTFHEDHFNNSPGSSPMRGGAGGGFVRDYNMQVSPPLSTSLQTHGVYDNPQKSLVSPPRYTFNPGGDLNNSNDSVGVTGAQNLSLHHNKDAIQLDLSIYKSHYGFVDASGQFRKDFRLKFELDGENRKQLLGCGLELENNDGENNHDDRDCFDPTIPSDQKDLDLSMRVDLRNKFDLDLELRAKTYEEELRSRVTYETSLDDFRLKSYELSDSLDTRNGLDIRNTFLDTGGLGNVDFRTDRNFEPLVLTSTANELQGLDMSARGGANNSNNILGSVNVGANVVGCPTSIGNNTPPGTGSSSPPPFHHHHSSYHHRYHHLAAAAAVAAAASHHHHHHHHHHPLYPEAVDGRDLRLNYGGYSPPVQGGVSYSHGDILRAVALDGGGGVTTTAGGRHSVDLTLRTPHAHRLSLDTSRLLSLPTSPPPPPASLSLVDPNPTNSRLLAAAAAATAANSSLADITQRMMLSDHTTNRLLTMTGVSMPSMSTTVAPMSSSSTVALNGTTNTSTNSNSSAVATVLMGNLEQQLPGGGGGGLSPVSVSYAPYSMTSPVPPSGGGGYHHSRGMTSPPPPTSNTAGSSGGYHHYSAYY